MKTENLFLTFLNSNNCLYPFIRCFFEQNPNRSILSYLNHIDAFRAISCAFLWIATSEGVPYWTKIDALWIDFLKQQEQTGKACDHRREERR